MLVLDKETVFVVKIKNSQYDTFKVDSYFTLKEKADSRAFSCGGKVFEADLWLDEDGNWYVVDTEKVLVDVPTKQEVLEKLSEAEKKALGL